MDHKKKKKKKHWKHLNNFSKAITKFFSGFTSSSHTPSRPSISSERKSSLYKCPCGYHSRQREEHRWQLEEANSMQRHQNVVEDKINVHGEGVCEGNNSTGIFLITEYEYEDYNHEENGENMDDVYASGRSRSRDGAAAVKELEDVDERAEKFITEFREQLRIQRLLSEKSISRYVFD